MTSEADQTTTFVAIVAGVPIACGAVTGCSRRDSGAGQRLEALSGYRHVQLPGDPRNPTILSHVVLGIAGRRHHVLSRVADAGHNYSQRSNKIAHHVVLGEHELVLAGSAWLLSQPGFMGVEWSGEPRVLESGRIPLDGELRPGACDEWQRVAAAPPGL